MAKTCPKTCPKFFFFFFFLKENRDSNEKGKKNLEEKNTTRAHQFTRVYELNSQESVSSFCRLLRILRNGSVTHRSHHIVPYMLWYRRYAINW